MNLVRRAGIALILIERAVLPMGTWPRLAGVLLVLSGSLLSSSSWTTPTRPSRAS